MRIIAFKSGSAQKSDFHVFHTVKTSWWQRLKGFLFLNVAGLLSCMSKDSPNLIANVGHSKTVILKFFKGPEGKLSVKTQADLSIQIRQHQWEKGFRNKKLLQRPRLLSRHKLAWKKESFIFWWKEIQHGWAWWLPTLLAWWGAPTGDVFYAAKWRRLHHDLWSFVLQWNNEALGCAGASNSSRLCGDVAEGTPLDWRPSSVWWWLVFQQDNTTDFFQENFTLLKHPVFLWSKYN